MDRKHIDYDGNVMLDTGISTGVATIVVDTTSGDNFIIVTPGANHELSASDVDQALQDWQPAVVLVQLEIQYPAALQALKTGKQLGAITILNPAPAPKKGELDDWFQYCDIFIPNETELQKVAGGKDGDSEEKLAKQLLSGGIGQAVVVTLGARGALIVPKNGEVMTVDAPPDLPARNEPVQDTIGAGDAFCGSLATYLSAGLELPEAAGKACGFASMSVRRKGASYPAAHELPELLQV